MSIHLSNKPAEKKQYIVEKLLAKRRRPDGTSEYLLDLIQFGDDDNIWVVEQDIDPDLIIDFKRRQKELLETTPIPIEGSIVQPRLSPLYIKARKTTSSKPSYGIEKGWIVEAVVGACRKNDSSLIYAVDYVQNSPLKREYIPSEIAHIYIPHKLIEFFQNRIIWNSATSVDR